MIQEVRGVANPRRDAERPDAFGKLARLDEKTLDRLVAQRKE